MSEAISFQYRAFLSYSHKDKRWAAWLHKRLEGFKLGKELVGRETSLGAVPASLRPIFRDRDEFTGGHSLTEATIVALDASAALVVLCSPAAAASYYVNEEVRLFRWRHPERPVIPVLVGGEGSEGFPPALRFDVDPTSGVLTDKPITVLGPDLRESADGIPLGLAKAVAGITGLSTDEVFNRLRRQQRRAATIRNSIIGVLAILTVAASGSAVVAWQNAAAREAMLGDAIGITQSVVHQVVNLRDYVPKTIIENLLDQADDGFTRLLARDTSNEILREQYGLMLLQFSRHYHSLGLAAKHFDRATKAREVFSELHKQAPASARYRNRLAEALTQIGNAEITLGRLPAASSTFLEAQQLLLAGFGQSADRFSKMEARDILGQKRLLISEMEDSEPLGRKRQLVSEFGTNMAGTRGLGPTDIPDVPSEELRRRWNAAKATIRRGDVAFEQGNFGAAREYFAQAYSTIEKLHASFADDLTETAERAMHYDLGVTKVRAGDVYRESGKNKSAGGAYDQAHSHFRWLISRDPKNNDYSRLVAVIFARRGLLRRQEGNIAASKADLEESIQLFEKLLSRDPRNSGWKRDLQVTLGNLGEITMAGGELSTSMSIFLRAEGMAKEIVQLDETNSVWRNDFAITTILVGVNILRLGDHDQAMDRFKRAKVELEKLVNADPSNEIWQLELQSLQTLQASIGEKPSS